MSVRLLDGLVRICGISYALDICLERRVRGELKAIQRPLNPGERGRSSHIDLYKRFHFNNKNLFSYWCFSVPVSIDFNSLSENSFDQYQKLVVTRASNSCFRRFKEHAQANEESISKANPGIVAGLNSEGMI